MMAMDDPDHIDISDQPALVRPVEAVKRSNRAAVLYRGAEEFAILAPRRGVRRKREAPRMADPNDIWAGYDPEHVRRALARSAAAFKDLDKDAFLADLAAQRQQDTRGRPGDT